MVIRGTQKLLKELGVPGQEPAAHEQEPPPLFEWYGNLIRIERRKCLVFVESSTLFTFMIPAVTKARYREFRKLFLDHLAFALHAVGVQLGNADFAERISFARTRDRRIIGSMNDLIFQLTHDIAWVGGLRHADPVDVIRRVNRTPMTLIDSSPDRAIRECIGSPYN